MELGILIFAVTASAILLKIWSRTHASASDGLGLIAVDLPCPWCKAATIETDAACPSCGQVFGE